MPAGRLVRTLNAIAIDRAGMHIRQVAVPDLVGVFGQLEARRLALTGFVEQAELDTRRIGRKQREVRPLAVPGGAKRMRQTFPNQARGNCYHRGSLWLHDAGGADRRWLNYRRRGRSENELRQNARITSPSRLAPWRTCTTRPWMVTSFFRALAALFEPPMRQVVALSLGLAVLTFARSEERRVGKECRCRWWPYPLKKKKKDSPALCQTKNTAFIGLAISAALWH